jgi:Family of unknown function (DUF6188)
MGSSPRSGSTSRHIGAGVMDRDLDRDRVLLRAAGCRTPVRTLGPTAQAPLLGLHQAVVTAAQIRKDGRLTMTFADDAVLDVGPDERYEAFQVTGSLRPSAGLPAYRSARRRPGSLLTISAPRALLRRCAKPLRGTEDASRC